VFGFGDEETAFAQENLKRKSVKHNMKFPIADALSFLVVTSFWLSSCSTQSEYQSVAKEEKIQGYGAPLTMDYQAFIKKWFSTRLKDPHSAVYTFSQPQKGYQAKAPVPFGPGGYWLGYRVDVMVNAKNSFGGYVSAKKYTFWFRDNQLLTISVPNDEA
jgi:hypothetical protein